MMTRSLLLISLTSAAFAQVGGPVLGYVPEGASIRQLYGLPAAGAIGAILKGGREFSSISISPAQNFALATDAATGQVMVVKFGLSQAPLSSAVANPGTTAISPSGLSAALYSQGRLQIVTGLPDSPVLQSIDASFLNASPTQLAVSDDGLWAVGIWSSGVYAFSPSAQTIPLQTDASPVALAFFHNNHNLALATAARATQITDVGGANQPSLLYDYSAQSLSPIAMATSFDNQEAVIASSSGKIVNLSVATSGANIVDCGCSPAGVFPLGGSIFRLTSTPGPKRNALERGGFSTDLKVFDAAAGAVWIVPPALADSGARQ